MDLAEHAADDVAAAGHAAPRRLPALLRRAWYGLNLAFRRRIAHLGITPDQFTVLRLLMERPGLTQRELTGSMTSDPNTVTSLVRRMERAGLLERRPHESDRRAWRLGVTPAGGHKFRQAHQFALALQQDVLAELPPAQQERFLAHLARVSDACRRAAEA